LHRSGNSSNGFKFFDRNEQITEQKKRQKAESAQQHLVITLGFSKPALRVDCLVWLGRLNTFFEQQLLSFTC
jgi:hypothetical protein